MTSGPAPRASALQRRWMGRAEARLVEWAGGGIRPRRTLALFIYFSSSFFVFFLFQIHISIQFQFKFPDLMAGLFSGSILNLNIPI
jgi:hypothetical protein